jgi:hypothetical protein
MKTKWLPVMTMMALMGCASSAMRPSESSLKTLITDNGLKFFELSFPELPGQLLQPSANTSQTPPQTLTTEKMQRITSHMVDTSGYCQSGHKLLGRFAGQTVNTIRGECIDKANANDRQKFPNTIERW